MPFDKDGKWVKPEKDWEKVRGPKETHTTAISKKTHEGNKLRASSIMQPIDIQESISRFMDTNGVEVPTRINRPKPTSSNGPAPRLLQDIPGLSKEFDWGIPDNSLLKIQPVTRSEAPDTNKPTSVLEDIQSKGFVDWLMGLSSNTKSPFTEEGRGQIVDAAAKSKENVTNIAENFSDPNKIKEIGQYGATGAYNVLQGPYLEKIFPGLTENITDMDNLGAPLRSIQETNKKGIQGAEDISPAVAGAADFAGQVLGDLPAIMAAGATGGRIALKGADALLKQMPNAPRWMQTLFRGASSGAGTGATLGAGKEAIQELGDPDEQSFGEHLKDVGHNTAIYAGYGAATPIAEKIMGASARRLEKALPSGVNQALNAVGQKAPLLKDVGQGVVEGGLTGSMVGSGMALGTLATTGDPSKALDVITGEASSEMKENFVQSIAFGIIRVLGGKGVHVDPQQASEEVAEIIMSQFPPELRVKVEMMVEEAKIQGADDAQAKAQVIDLMGSLPDGKEVIEQAAAQILQDIQTATESTPSVIQRVASWYNNLGDEGVLPSAPDKVSPIISDPTTDDKPKSPLIGKFVKARDEVGEFDVRIAKVDGDDIYVEHKNGMVSPTPYNINMLSSHDGSPLETVQKPESSPKQTTAEKEQALSEFFESDRPEENELIQKYAETFVTSAKGDVSKAVGDMKELLSGAESMFKDDPNSLRRFKAALTHLEGQLTESKTPATTSKTPETPKVQTQASSKQSVKAVKGDTVKLKGKPNDTFEVVDIDKTKVTLKSNKGTTFVSGAGSIESVVNTAASTTENEPTTVKKYGRNGNVALNKELKASSIDLDSSDGRDFEHFFEKYYNAGAKGNFMPNADIHKDMAKQFYEAGKKDKVANKPEEIKQEIVKDDPDFVIMKTKSLQSSKEELTVRHKDFPEQTVKLTPSESNATYIAKFQDSQKVVSNKEDAILWAKDRLKESQSNNISDLETGKKLKLTLFQGKGASLEEVYGKEAIEEGRAVPVLGKGDYYAFNSNDAANYGTVTSKEIKLNNPIIIYAGQQFRNLLEKADALHLDSQDALFYKEPEKIAEATQKLQDYLIGLGHDGAVIQVGDNKRLIETFGHDQVVVFGSNSEQAVQKPTKNDTLEANKLTPKNTTEYNTKTMNLTKLNPLSFGDLVSYRNAPNEELPKALEDKFLKENFILQKSGIYLSKKENNEYVGEVVGHRVQLQFKPSKQSIVVTHTKESKNGKRDTKHYAIPIEENISKTTILMTTEVDSKQEPQVKATIGPVLNDHHAKMKERAERAKQRIKDKYGPGGNTLSSGFPPDLMIDFSIIGYTKILDGLADFKSWSESMMKDADGLVANSERIRKWLPGIYTMSKQIAESDDPDSLMDEFLVDAYGENPETKNEVPATKGKTIKLFHGSDKTFDKFRSGSAQAGKGIFFTDNAESAKEYGKNIYIVEVEAKKIANDDDWRKTVEEIDEEYTTARRKIEEDFDNDLISESEMDTLLDKSHSEWLIGESADHKQNAMVSDRLKAIGFDIYQGDMQSGDEGKEYIVLDDSIIKSVTIGTDDKVWFHGTTKSGFDTPTKSETKFADVIFLAKNREAAAAYAGDTGRVIPLVLKDNAKIADASNHPDRDEWHEIPLDAWKKITKIADDLGYDLGNGQYKIDPKIPLTFEAIIDGGPGGGSGYGAGNDLKEILLKSGYDGIMYMEPTAGIVGDARERGLTKTDLSTIEDKGYVKSLALFNPEAVSTINEKGANTNDTQPLRDNGKGPLEETPSEDVQGTSSNGTNTSSTSTSTGKDGRNANETTPSTDREGSSTGSSEQSAEDRLRDTKTGSSVGDGEGDVHSPTKRGGRTKSGTKSSTVSGKKPGLELNQPRRDFVITDELDNLGGVKSRFKSNVEAIRILSSIEQEGRIATPEEQAQLSKYVGWGGLAQAFDAKNANWEKEFQTLQGLVQDGIITKEEYETARRTTQYAHYTTQEVVNVMYQIVQQMGFKGGQILEPAMGTGNFFGMMPNDMTALSNRTGIEMDPLSGRIAKQLYQKANIQIKGFEDYKVTDGYFDMVIGNPPFSGEVKISYNKKRENLHNYFFLQSLDKVRDGGIVAFVTSSGTMNAESGARVRKLIASKANFLGAIRLPGDAFKKNAGTEVTTDIIFLQKRAKGENEAHIAPFIETKPFRVGENTFDNNEYFINHPDRVLGDYVEDKLYQGRIGVKSDGRNMEDSLKAIVEKFPSNIYEERSTKAQKEPAFQEVSYDKMHELHDGAYAISSDGQVIQRVGDQMQTTNLKGLKADRIKNMVPVRDQARSVIRLMLNNVSDAQLKSAQAKLNTLYDKFVEDYGLLNDSANISAFSPDSLGTGVLMALEKKNKKGEIEKEAIFRERTISGQSQSSNVETAEEALVVSLFETGRLDFARMSELSGKSEGQLVEELQGKIFHDPVKGLWVTEDEYLSGNVRLKLQEAENSRDDRHAGNAEALRGVQPDDLQEDQIFVKLGAPWVSTDDYHNFISDFLEIDHNALKVMYNPIISKFTIVEDKFSFQMSKSVKNTDEYGVHSESLSMRKSAVDMMEDFMNGKTTVFTKTYRDGSKASDDIATNAAKRMQGQINDIFKSWIWTNESRTERLIQKYNWELNNSRLRDYNGETVYGKAEDFVKLPGSTIALRKHQINAVWRIVQGGNTLLAHVVGSGKTYTVIAAAMEMKRLGLVNKSAVVVPNHLIAQWRNDFLKAYPNSNVLVISNDDIPPVTTRKGKGMSDKEFKVKQDKQRSERAAALSKIAVGNYDAVLISHQTFGRLPVSSEMVQQHIRDQIAEVRHAMEQATLDDPKGKTVKDLEKTLESLEKKLKEDLSSDNKDIAIPFEELGVDQIFVDEAHMFKNLKFHTKMRNVSSLPQTNSMRAQDMYLKTQYLSNLRGNKGIVFATGTPISNTVAEMFTIQRYLGMRELKNLGMNHFDAWAATFGNVVTDFEQNAAGQYKQKTRFSEFNNVPELMNLFETFTDIQTAGMLDLPNKPANLKYETIIVEMSPDQKEYQKELLERAENMKNVSPEVDNFLKLTGDGRKAALDIRLVRPDITKDFPDSKINAAVNNMVRIYNDPDLAKDKDGNTVDRPAQLVFLDMGTPKKKNETDESQDARKEDDEDEVNVSTYADIKRKLIAQGIPVDEISFIHEANTDKRKETLFADVRSGKIRFLLGSTEKMGAGMNVQERLIALHHIDAPWRPSDVEQREGRINRQGNENDSIYIYQYTTKGSFDKLMWDILARKAFMIEQVMSGETKSRTLEDMEPMVFRFAEVAAASADNPIFIEKQKIDRLVFDLESEKTQFERKRSELKRSLAYMPNEITKLDKKNIDLQIDSDRAKSISKKDQIMVVNGKRFEIEGAEGVSEVQEEAGKLLIAEYQLANDRLNRGEGAVIGSFAGFDIVIRKGYGLHLYGKLEHDAGINEESPTGTYSRIRNAFEKITEDSGIDIRYNKNRIEDMENKITEFKRLVEVKFEKNKDLEDAINRQFEITQELIALNSEHEQAVQETDDEDSVEFDTYIPQNYEKVELVEEGTAPKTVPSTKKESEGSVSKSDIVKYIMKEFKVSLGTGKYRGQIRGLYKPGPNVIRTKMFGDFLTLSHELGHRLERKYELSDEVSIQEELYNLAHANLAIPENMKDEQIYREGVADFLRMYFYEPQNARNQAPEFFEFFENKMEDEGLLDKLYTLSDMLETWHGQSAEKRVSGVIDKQQKRGFQNPFKNVYANYVDELVGIEKAVDRLMNGKADDLQGKDNPHLLAWKYRGIAGKIQTFLEHGVMNEDGVKVSSSLKEILTSVKDLEVFRNYITSKHAITLRKEGKWKTPISMADAKKIVDNTPKEYVDAADMLYEFQDAITMLLIRSGMIEKGKLKEWKEAHPFYVPFYRVLEESGESDSDKSGGGGQGKSFANLPKAVKAMKEEGSGKNIIDPLMSVIKNTFMYISLAERNNVGRAMARLVDGIPESGSIMEKIDRPMKGQTFQLSEIEGVLQEAGFDVEGLDLEETATIFRPLFTPSMTDRVLIVWVNGKQQFYQVRDQDLYDAFLSLDGETMKTWVKMLSIPNNVLRTGITSSPTFIPKGPLRALPTMIMQSDSYTTPLDFLQLPFDLAKGFMDSVGKTDAYHEWLESGAGQSTILSIERDYLLESKNRLLHNSVKEIALREAKTLGLGAVYKALRHLNEITDQGFRIAEYKKARKKTGDRVKAAVRSRDVDVDFNRFGKDTKTINRINLFFNVAIQGPQKTYRTFKAHPFRTTMRGALFLTLPSLALMALNWDDEDYWELEQWERDLFWNIPKGDGTFVRIPIPFEWGLIFKVIPERIVSAFARDDRKAFDGYFKTIKDTMVPSTIPTYVIPGIEWATGVNLSTGIPILTMGDQSKAAEDQYGVYTSEFAKRVGKALEVSPKKIDHAVKGTTGSLGQLVVSGVDFVTGGRNEEKDGAKPEGQRNIFERAFVADSADGSTFSTNKFYNLLDEKEKDHKKNGVKGEPGLLLKYLRKASDELSEMRKLRDAVHVDKTLSGKDKGKAIHQINLAITDLARILTKNDARNKENLQNVMQWNQTFSDSQK